MRASLLASLFLVACLDPEAPPAEVGTAPGATPPPPSGQEGAPGGDNGGANTPPPTFEIPTIEPGTGVKLSGTTTYAGTKTGKVRIDVLSMKAGATMPGLVATKTVDAVGTWAIEIPKNAGDVHVVAFLDLANNGPDSTDPAGRTKDPVKMAEAAVGGVSVEILDKAELGDLTPGNAPRSDKDAAPKAEDAAKPADGAAAAPATDGAPADAKAAEAKPADPKAAPSDAKTVTTDPKAPAATTAKPADAKAASTSAKPSDTKATTEGRTKPSEKKGTTSGSKSTGRSAPAPTEK